MKHKCGQGAFLESCDPAQQITKSEEALVAFFIYMAGRQKYKRPGLQASQHLNLEQAGKDGGLAGIVRTEFYYE